ncbi:3596_t:CDS:2, partial [Gigaspora rosea]
MDFNYPICNDDDIPKCLLKYFEEELQKNSVKFLQNLLKDSEKFVKFLNGLAIATLINLSESALKGFACIVGDKISELAKDALEAMKKCAKTILGNRQPESKILEEEIKAVECAQTLNSAVDLAGPLFLTSGEWFGYFGFAIKFITDDLKNLFGDQSDEETRINKEKIKMEMFDKRIKNAVEKFLNMDDLIPKLEFNSDSSLKIEWSIPIGVKNDKLVKEIHYNLQIIIFGKETIKKQIIVGKDEIENDKSNYRGLSYVFKDGSLMKCKNLSVKITAILQHDQHKNYSGSQSKEGKIEHEPKLYPPTKLESAYDSREKLIPGPGGEYKIRVSAKANNLKESVFKYTDKIISRLSPPISVKFD